MLNWKNLTAFSVVCVLGSTQANAEVVLGGSNSEMRTGEFSGGSPLLTAAPATTQAANAVGFDLNYRTAPLSVAVDFKSNQFRDASPVATRLPVAAMNPVSAFGLTTRVGDATVADRFAHQTLSVTPIPPAGSEVEPVSTFGIFTQRWKRSSNVELSGNQVNADGGYTGETGITTVKSSGMPLIGYTAASASLMGLMLGAFRRGWLSNTSK